MKTSLIAAPAFVGESTDPERSLDRRTPRWTSDEGAFAGDPITRAPMEGDNAARRTAAVNVGSSVTADRAAWDSSPPERSPADDPSPHRPDNARVEGVGSSGAQPWVRPFRQVRS